jgi:hypothetical protein
MDGLRMERQQIVARDLRDRLDRALPRIGVIGPIEQFGKLAPGDGLRLVLPAPDRLDRLQPGQLDPRRVEDRRHQDVGEQAQPARQVLRQHVQHGRAGFRADAGGDRRRHVFELAVEFLGAQPPSAACPHGGARDASEADLVGRIEPASGSDRGCDRDQRQLVVFEQIDHHAVAEHDALRLRRRERHRFEGHQARIAERR